MKRWQQFNISLLALACFTLAICPLALGESVMVPMRDGVKLPTIIALPGSGSYPVVLTRGYTASGLSSHAGRFNKAGYAFVSQQCRGGGGSDGTRFFPDDKDGYDAIEWIGRMSSFTARRRCARIWR